jgi:hypothetical protein
MSMPLQGTAGEGAKMPDSVHSWDPSGKSLKMASYPGLYFIVFAIRQHMRTVQHDDKTFLALQLKKLDVFGKPLGDDGRLYENVRVHF